ncbi:hypothetical protein P12x_004233 [Tundrisphaera lichenicola]|uniref:hypothetical protein n=1 Tax=Tundrisphaera lichenicola TaxID=2029860 RepID=UPI003EBFC228
MSRIDESPGSVDRVLMLAEKAWGGPAFVDLLEKFAVERRESLRIARSGFAKLKPIEAFDRLRSEHQDSARPDLSRIHPSWIVRALRNESPSILRLVSSHGPHSIRKILLQDRGTADHHSNSLHEGDPEAIGWALTLWKERLLGGPSERDDDPPVVIAITRMKLREVARLVKVCGQVKHAYAIEGHGPSPSDESLVRMSTADRVRIGFFRRQIGQADRRLVEAARGDLGMLDDERHRGHSWVGLLTIGRLLQNVEPARARWAIQHLPYTIVKSMKARSASTLPERILAAWESWILEAAWARLLSEGRMCRYRGNTS